MKALMLTVAFLAGLLVSGGCARQPKLTTSSDEAVRRYEAGVRLYENFYYGEAAAEFEAALAADSNFAMAWARLGMIARESGLPAEASAAMKRALQLREGASDREQMYIRVWDLTLRNQLAPALAAADSLVRAYPKEKEARVMQGQLAGLNNNLEAALKAFQAAAELDTAYALPMMHIGYTYSRIGDQEKAIQAMKRYIRLAPESADPRASLADLLMWTGRYAEALEQYNESLRLKPDYWYSIRQIGEIYLTLGRLRAAEPQYHAYLQLLPQGTNREPMRLAFDASLEFYRGEYDKAIALTRKALASDTTLGLAAYVMVHSLRRSGRFEEAAATLDRIYSELERRNATKTAEMIRYNIARAALEADRGNASASLAFCDSALQYTTVVDRWIVYRQMAEVYLRLRQYDDALSACEDALAVNPNTPSVLLTLTRVYDAMGDRQMSQEIGNRLLVLWRDADSDFRDLGELKKLLGRRFPT